MILENFASIKLDVGNRDSDIRTARLEFFREERIFGFRFAYRTNPEVDPVKSLKNCRDARLIPAFGPSLSYSEGVQKTPTARPEICGWDIIAWHSLAPNRWNPPIYSDTCVYVCVYV